jgi:hypothetical protein
VIGGGLGGLTAARARVRRGGSAALDRIPDEPDKALQLYESSRTYGQLQEAPSV